MADGEPFDELDSLLEMEMELAEGEEGSHKRGRADLQSQREAAAALGGGGADGGGPDSAHGSKRARLGPAGAAPSQQPSFRPLSETEEQELLALAADSQPPGSQTIAAAAAATTTAGARRTTTGAAPGAFMSASEEQQLLALAASTQPTRGPPPTARTSGAAAAGGASLARGGAAAAAEAENEFDDFDLLDELIEEEEREKQAQQAGQAGQQPGQQQQGGRAAAAAPAAAAAGSPAAAEAAAAAAEAPILPRRQYVPPAREVYRIAGASLAVTSEAGDRVYCHLQAAQPGSSVGRRVDLMGALRRARGGLLSESIDSLLAAVDKDQYDRALAETAREAASAGGSAEGGGEGGRRRSREGAGAGGRASSSSSLWVQKYAPKGYLDLLSDEQINREVVRWLQSWGPCVFGTPAPGAPQHAQQRGQYGQRGGQYGGGGGFGQRGGKQHQMGGGGGGVDALGRPEHKVILIAGPPGLGKTTLAHICAAHCGYRPLEINASDDRSATTLQSRVLDAVEMQSVMGQRRPNCVIIDEIDGATGGAEGRSGIAALIKIINAQPGKAQQGKQDSGRGNGGGRGRREAAEEGDADSDSEEEQEEDGEERGSRSAGRSAGVAARRGGRAGPAGAPRKQLRPLLRPIICICNDLYAPALRPLRDVAKVFHFKKPQAERLAQRLQSICAAEGLRCEKSTLRLLVERTECDVRSCLNTLQFLAHRGHGTVSLSDLAGLRIGLKDMTKGAFSLWTDLLQKRKAPGIVGKAAESESQRMQRLFGMLQDFGESDLVLGGIHENVLGLHYFDLALKKTTEVIGFLGDADRFLRACHRSCDFGMLKYVPAPLVAVSYQVAGPDRPQLQWPRAAFDCPRRTAANVATLQGWMLGMSPAAVAATSMRSMILEVLPHLMHIAAPALRPVSQHLYSPAEQEAVRQLVDTLLGYNLRYCLEPTPEERAEEEEQARQRAAGEADGGDGQQGQQGQQRVRGAPAEPPLRFRPAVHRVCAFPGMPPKGKTLPAAVRQVVSHEADMEAIRRAEHTRLGHAGNSPAGAAAGGSGSALADANQQPQRPALPSGPVPVTLAERMKAAAAAAGGKQPGSGGSKAAPRKATWLDALKEQRLARAAGAGGGARAGGGAEGDGKQRNAVLYKFLEGCTNAVKRPVRMRDLL